MCWCSRAAWVQSLQADLLSRSAAVDHGLRHLSTALNSTGRTLRRLRAQLGDAEQQNKQTRTFLEVLHNRTQQHQVTRGRREAPNGSGPKRRRFCSDRC